MWHHEPLVTASLLSTFTSLWPLGLSLIQDRKNSVRCYLWAEKGAPTEPRQLGFVTVWLHRTSGELKYRMIGLRKTYVIISHDFFFHMIFLKNTNRGTDREGNTKHFLYPVLIVDLNEVQFVLNATDLLMDVPAKWLFIRSLSLIWMNRSRELVYSPPKKKYI